LPLLKTLKVKLKEKLRRDPTKGVKTLT